MELAAELLASPASALHLAIAVAPMDGVESPPTIAALAAMQPSEFAERRHLHRSCPRLQFRLQLRELHQHPPKKSPSTEVVAAE
jgi:hypothetical protein